MAAWHGAIGSGGLNLHGLLVHYGLVALFLAAGFEGEAAVVAGGLLAHRGLFSLPGAMVAASAGSFVADQLFFAAGRYFRHSAWVRRQQGRPVFSRALAMLERYPITFIFAFRFIYGFRTISPIAIGTSGVREPLFLTVNAIAAIVWGVTFTAIGYAFGNRVEALLHRFEPTGMTIAIVVGVVVVAMVAIHLIRRRRLGVTAPHQPPREGA